MAYWFAYNRRQGMATRQTPGWLKENIMDEEKLIKVAIALAEICEALMALNKAIIEDNDDMASFILNVPQCEYCAVGETAQQFLRERCDD